MLFLEDSEVVQAARPGSDDDLVFVMATCCEWARPQ